MVALENRRASSLAAPSRRLLTPSEGATSTPKNCVWGFESSPSGRPSIDQQLSWETAAGSVQYTYQIASGRAEWLSRDPYVDKDGNPAELALGPNLYQYVLNNPLSYRDKLGLDIDDGDPESLAAYAEAMQAIAGEGTTTIEDVIANQASSMGRGVKAAVDAAKEMSGCPESKARFLSNTLQKLASRFKIQNFKATIEDTPGGGKAVVGQPTSTGPPPTINITAGGNVYGP